ncbi:hypothetical protein VPNG_04560 [Cytospora leucostoma]|uniref:Uncharacterized protein n=1 Tax=Cytospora leucostoma TaxID=1230097 RepID=A0A423XC66_9PEZI|nr:hypothetical protein VPNG_04560 [Cytospora leucostoma]
MASSQGGVEPPVLDWPVWGFWKSRMDECSQRTNWKGICERASRANGGQPCKLLAAKTSGRNRLARLLEFQDGTRWIAYVQLQESDQESSRALKTEIDTMALLLRETRAPVPRVFAFEADDDNPAGSAFMLLELVPGNNALVEIKRHTNAESIIIPPDSRETFHRSMAAAHVQIASARLPQIGTVKRDADGSFSVGPIPGIGGPFDTAASFIQAYAAAMEFPYSHEYVRRFCPPAVADEVLEGQDGFPARLAALAASGKHFTREGPFPVQHPHLTHDDVIVNRWFDVLGVIDWEGAHTVPWELVHAPLGINTLPRQIVPPEQFDEAGQPLDADDAERLAHEREYAAMVRDAERGAHADHRLSDVLADRDAQDIASACSFFLAGKAGYYGRLMDYFENK